MIYRLDPASGELGEMRHAEGTVVAPADALLHVVAFRSECLEPLLPAARQVDGLEINKTAITDDALAPVARFANLRFLNGSKARKVGDAGIRHLAGLSKLEYLDLYSSQVTDAGLTSLAGLESLKHLHLGMTRVQGSGLAALRGLRHLSWLSVEGMPIEDAAVAGIDCPGLSKLVLRWTRVTAAGVEAFRLRFPRCEVVVDLDITEKNLRVAASGRQVLTLLVRRLVDRHPLKEGDGDAAVAEVVGRLFPPGTQFESLVPGAEPSRPVVVCGDWRPDELGASDPAVMLRFLPRGSQVRISFPGGGRVVVPWLVTRGPDRRRPRPKVLAN